MPSAGPSASAANTELHLPLEPFSIVAARNFVEDWARKAGLEGRVLQRFVFAVGEIVEAAVVLAQEMGVEGNLEIKVEPVEGWITTHISFPSAIPLAPVFDEGESELEHMPGRDVAPEVFWRRVVAEWVDKASWRHTRHRITISLTQYARAGGNPAQLYFLNLKPKAPADLALYEGEHHVVAASGSLRSAFRLTPQAAFVLSQCNGTRSVRDIYRAYADHFGLVHPKVVGAIVEELASKGLVRLGKALVDSSPKRRWLAKLWAMQYSVPNPDKWVETINRWIGWAWSAKAAVIYLGFIAVSIPLVWTRHHWGNPHSEIAYLEPWDLIVLAALMNLHILVHELSHCLVCKRLGGRIHALGVIFYYGLICPFADTTEAWGLPNRWHRAMVSLAGPLCDLTASTLYAWIKLWATSTGWEEAGAIAGLMSELIFFSALFNLMPLLETDGYYALSDILGVSNLRRRSWERLKALLRGKARRLSRSDWAYVAYGVSSLIAVGAFMGYPLAVLISGSSRASQVGWVMAELFVVILALKIAKGALAYYKQARQRHTTITLKTP